MLMAPTEVATPTATEGTPMVHPDPGLGLPPNEAVARLRVMNDETLKLPPRYLHDAAGTLVGAGGRT